MGLVQSQLASYMDAGLHQLRPVYRETLWIFRCTVHFLAQNEAAVPVPCQLGSAGALCCCENSSARYVRAVRPQPRAPTDGAVNTESHTGLVSFRNFLKLPSASMLFRPPLGSCATPCAWCLGPTDDAIIRRLRVLPADMETVSVAVTQWQVLASAGICRISDLAHSHGIQCKSAFDA